MLTRSGYWPHCPAGANPAHPRVGTDQAVDPTPAHAGRYESDDQSPGEDGSHCRDVRRDGGTTHPPHGAEGRHLWRDAGRDQGGL